MQVEENKDKKWGLKIRNYHFFLKGWLKVLKDNQT